MVNHNPAIGLVIGLPGGIGAVARIGLLVGPSHEQADAHVVEEPQDLYGVRLVDAQSVLQGRTVQPLMSSVFDAPVWRFLSKKASAPIWPGARLVASQSISGLGSVSISLG